MLNILKGGIKRYKSLYIQASIIQYDILTNNFIINKEANNPSQLVFLINFNFTIKEQREGPLGVQGKTNIKIFIAIGVLLGEIYLTWHDFKSFFQVLFQIYIYYNGLNKKGNIVNRFNKWNSINIEELAKIKKGEVNNKGDFLKGVDNNFSLYYQLLIPQVNRLQKVVFPGSKR